MGNLTSTDKAEKAASIRAVRTETLGCWWSSRAYPKLRPRWDAIINELEGRREDFFPPKNLEELIVFAKAQGFKSADEMRKADIRDGIISD